jgi:phosphate starvation-inducible membrane PsiE
MMQRFAKEDEETVMAKLTMVFGVLLVVVSLGFWIAMGRVDSAALHPAGLGVLLVLCGALANTENSKRRMLWMHLAVTVGLVGFLITGVRAVIQVVKGTTAVNPAAFEERAVVALICLLFVALCVRSFISARRSRVA